MRRLKRVALALACALAALVAMPGAAEAAGSEQMWRLYNRWTGEHLFTADTNEYAELKGVGWTQEGKAWLAPTAGEAVYRLYNPYVEGGDHHYTRDKNEYMTLRGLGWKGEDVAWRSAPKEGGTPLYRLYNEYAKTGTHHYTADAHERDELVSVGWRYEGEAWYGVDPEQSKPSEPGGTDKPSGPSEPGGTDKPSDPGTPDQPDQPSDPGTSDKPGEPDDTDKPSEPEIDPDFYLTHGETNVVMELGSSYTFAVSDVVSSTSRTSGYFKLNKLSSTTYRVTALKTGRASVTFYHYDGNENHSVECSITVVDKGSSQAVTVPELWFIDDKSSGAHDPNTSWTLTTSNTIKSVTSSNTSVASVTETKDNSVELLAKRQGSATITVTDEFGQKISYKATVSAPPLLLLEQSVEEPEIGKRWYINATNKIESVTSSNEDVLVYCELYYNNQSAIVMGKEPGISTVTVTDEYGQTESIRVQVYQKMYDREYEAVMLDSTRYDASLPVPDLQGVYYGESYITLMCDGDPEASDAYYGHEYYLCTSRDFDTNFEVTYENTDWNNRGYTHATFFYTRSAQTYYVKVRSYKMEGTTKVYGPWTAIRQIDVPNYSKQRSTPAKYTYELYFVDKTLNGSLYDGYYAPVYVKTENPSPNSIAITRTDGSRASNTTTSRTYDDVEYSYTFDADEDFRKVEGGYLTLIHLDEPGQLPLQIREYDSTGYAIAKQWTWTVKDASAARDAWMDKVIDEATDSSMNPLEKMQAISSYLLQRFKYVTNHDGYLVTLATTPNSPYFLSYRWDSYTSPAVLCQFAEEIGGFDDIHNCYGDYPYGSDGWYANHYICELTYQGEKYGVYACPTTDTGEVGNFAMIDFSNTASLIKAV